MMPAIISVMPGPSSPSGMRDFCIFSRIPAMAIIASDQPTLFAGLVGVTLVSAVLGHDYSQR